MKRTICFWLVAFLVAVSLALFGCNQNPYKPDTNSGSDNLSHSKAKVIFKQLDSWSEDNGVYVHVLGVAMWGFEPLLVDSPSLVGALPSGADWKNPKKGLIGHEDSDYEDFWVFELKTKKDTALTINFARDSKNWIQLKFLSGSPFFVESDEDGNGNLDIVCRGTKIYTLDEVPANNPGNTTVRVDTVKMVITPIVIVNGAGGRDTVSDTIFIYDSTKVTDTISEKATDTVKVKIPGDTVVFLLDEIIKVEGNPVKLSNGLFRNTYLFSPLAIKTVENGKPFVIGLAADSLARRITRKLGAKRSDGFYPYVADLAPNKFYTFGAGGDSAKKIWADSSIVKRTCWGVKTNGGWIFGVGILADGRPVPAKYYDSTGNKVVRDTVRLKGDSVFVVIIKNNFDTLYDTVRIKIDTIYFTKIDRGVMSIDSTKSFLADTSWLDADSLVAVVTEDTLLRVKVTHLVLIISPSGDTTPQFDTTIFPLTVFRYREDTLNFAFVPLGVVANLTNDTSIVRFEINAKAFNYLGRGDDSVSLIGLDTSLWTFIGKASGNLFIFDAKLVKGATYNLNFLGNKGTWAEQSILLLSPFAVQIGSNCDLVVKFDGSVLIKP